MRWMSAVVLGDRRDFALAFLPGCQTINDKWVQSRPWACIL